MSLGDNLIARVMRTAPPELIEAIDGTRRAHETIAASLGAILANQEQIKVLDVLAQIAANTENIASWLKVFAARLDAIEAYQRAHVLVTDQQAESPHVAVNGR